MTHVELSLNAARIRPHCLGTILGDAHARTAFGAPDAHISGGPGLSQLAEVSVGPAYCGQ
jgi:hypothetical protein